jgi:hypothetical protein
MLRMQEMTFPRFKFQTFSEGVHPQTPPFMRGILAPFSKNGKVPFQKMFPHGKILKKGPGVA